VCPFGLTDIMGVLEEDSKSGQLKPSLDEFLVEQVAQFLLVPIRKQYWQDFVESSQRTSTKGSAKDNATTEKEAERQLTLLRFILK